jgi:DNA ligase 1
MSLKRPMLACDWDEDAGLPAGEFCAQPKIDGVRALISCDGIVGRSLKPFANKYVAGLRFPALNAGYVLDGELFVGLQTDPDLCRRTTSALNSKEGEPILTFMVYDQYSPTTTTKPYSERLADLVAGVEYLQAALDELNVHVIPSIPNVSLAGLQGMEAKWLAMGYEGVILRKQSAVYKHGRSTLKGGELLRIKRFSDAEGVCTGIVQAQENQNEVVENALGLTERSSHKENKVPKNMVGALLLRLPDGSEVTVGPGAMTHAERQWYWLNQHALLGKLVKYKYFAHGQKDKGRFPTFLSVRAAEDTDA